MRIQKATAIMILGKEIVDLVAQSSKSRGQVYKFANMTLGGMMGLAVDAAENTYHMQSAIAVAQMRFFDALRKADQENLKLIMGLPETSMGVLDTAVAQQRIDDANRQIAQLNRTMQNAVTNAQRHNAIVQKILSSKTAKDACGTLGYMNITMIRAHYQSLIFAQQMIVSYNQMILQRAREYDRASAELYRAVNTQELRSATAAANNYCATGRWGSTTWVSNMCANIVKDGMKVVATSVDVAHKFFRGELKTGDSVIDGSWTESMSVLGIPISGTASGELIGYEASIKPYGNASEDGKGLKGAVGVEAKAGFYGAKGKLSSDVGPYVHHELEGQLLTGAVSGTLGASLFDENGNLSPRVEAKAKAEGSVLKGEYSQRIGTENYNYHTKAEGKVLTAKAEASAKFGADGIEAKAGAEAYVATGEVSGGFTFMGIKLDVSVEGKAGGVGAKAGGSVGPSSVEGEIGAGLGLGAGVKVKVDWSGAAKAAEDTVKGVSDFIGGIGEGIGNIFSWGG